MNNFDDIGEIMMMQENVLMHSLTKSSEKQMNPLSIALMLSKIQWAQEWWSQNYKRKENQKIWILILAVHAHTMAGTSDNLGGSDWQIVKKKKKLKSMQHKGIFNHCGLYIQLLSASSDKVTPDVYPIQ